MSRTYPEPYSLERMASDPGNAVVAEWVGPSGQQLFDGTALNPGVIVAGIGKDEAENSECWHVVGDVDSYKGDVPDVSAIRSDWSFGTEEGGEATGRPLTEDQVTAQTASKGRGKSAVSSAPTSATDGGSE